jgi:gliding motility-associated-like protein
MKFKMKINTFLLLILCSTFQTFGQLSFCNGSKGLPIFTEDFGSGTDYGPALPVGITSYTFIAGTPSDGFYTLYYRTNQYSSWHNSPDHTPDNQPNGTNGKSLIVNASFTPSEFYKRVVSGLCVNTTFEFSSWLMNVFNSTSTDCSGNSIPINVTFEIWNATETILLQTGNTGNINATSSAIWTQYGLVFTTGIGQTSVVLKMRNNSAGGCGNDLAIDDIMFRSCGDFTTIGTTATTGNTYSVCEDVTPININLQVNSSGITLNVFQWQESLDNVIWNDIIGENSSNYATPNITTTHYYRVKVAQDVANLNNVFCSTISEIFSIIIKPKPLAPLSNGNFIICENDAIPALSVTILGSESVNWYSAATGGTLLQSNSVAFTPSNAGIFYAESYTLSTCVSINRTAVQLTMNPIPVIVQNETAILCETKSVLLDAEINNVTYNWSTTETTKSITVITPGTYTVRVTSPNGCTNLKTIVVTESLIPIITNVIIDNRQVTIITAVSGDYEYSLDGINYQSSNVFENAIGGIKKAYVREKNNCGEVIFDFILIIIPKFFTPNGDTYNDFFSMEGFQFINNTTIAIFDRYGKLITYLNKQNGTWNGTLFGKPLPANDYWYKVILQDGTELKGHFALIR